MEQSNKRKATTQGYGTSNNFQGNTQLDRVITVLNYDYPLSVNSPSDIKNTELSLNLSRVVGASILLHLYGQDDNRNTISVIQKVKSAKIAVVDIDNDNIEYTIVATDPASIFQVNSTYYHYCFY